MRQTCRCDNKRCIYGKCKSLCCCLHLPILPHLSKSVKPYFQKSFGAFGLRVPDPNMSPRLTTASHGLNLGCSEGLRTLSLPLHRRTCLPVPPQTPLENCTA